MMDMIYNIIDNMTPLEICVTAIAASALWMFGILAISQVVWNIYRKIKKG